MRVLLTGASSFTGCHFASQLAARGHQVTASFREANPEAYADPLRRRRVEQAAAVCAAEFGCAFGDAKWQELACLGRFDVVACHGAEVANYRSPDFDFAAAVAANTRHLDVTLARLVDSGCRRIVLTGSVFEGGEGAGSDQLPHISAYGLSKALTAEAFRHFCRTRHVTLGKFVIPNPFGPLEEARFTHYLIRNWLAGESVTVNTPAYVRDNIHVSLLGLCYATFVESLPDDGKFHRTSPSGYIESQGAFAQRFAREMGPRLGLSCQLQLAEQTLFPEPRIRINTDVPDSAALDWNETSAWDALAEYYAALAL